jgi:hypothetical protein
MIVINLDDELAEIGFDRLHAVATEKIRELNLLAHHRLGLDHLGRAARAA